MGKLTIVVGLPGSGKTRLLREMESDRTRVFPDFLGHDRYAMGGLFDVLTTLHDGGDCVVDEAGFCVRKQREQFLAWLGRLFPEIKPELVFFAHDVESCLINLFGAYMADDRRGDFASRVHWCLEYAKEYSIPEEYEPRPVVTTHQFVAKERGG